VVTLATEVLTMAHKKTNSSLKLGDRVKIRNSSLHGRLVELFGALGPGLLASILRNSVARKSNRPYIFLGRFPNRVRAVI
jgi:hypothetical protein